MKLFGLALFHENFRDLSDQAKSRRLKNSDQTGNPIVGKSLRKFDQHPPLFVRGYARNNFTEFMLMLSQQIGQCDWAFLQPEQLSAKFVARNQKLNGLRRVQALVSGRDLFTLGNDRLKLLLLAGKGVGILQDLVEIIQLILQPMRILKRLDQLIDE